MAGDLGLPPTGHRDVRSTRLLIVLGHNDSGWSEDGWSKNGLVTLLGQRCLRTMMLMTMTMMSVVLATLAPRAHRVQPLWPSVWHLPEFDLLSPSNASANGVQSLPCAGGRLLE